MDTTPYAVVTIFLKDKNIFHNIRINLTFNFAYLDQEIMQVFQRNSHILVIFRQSFTIAFSVLLWNRKDTFM